MVLSGNNRFGVQEFAEVLRVRNAEGLPYILIGGQAVNYWAERYRSAEPELEHFLPFASQDIDFKGAREDVKQIAGQLGLTAVFPDTRAMTALAGIIPLRARGMESAVEVVRLVPGVRDEQIEASAMEADLGENRIRVLDPIWLTANKLDLAMTISQDERQDVRHLQIMILCVRTFLKEALASADRGELPAGAWLGAVNQMYKIARSGKGKSSVKKFGIEWAKFLPREEIEAAKNEKIVRIREMQLAAWKF